MSDHDTAPFEILAPPQWTVPAVFSSPHSGSHLPPGFVGASRLTPAQLRMSEDTHVDDLFSGCIACGIPLMRSIYSRSYIDLNREPFELDARMFQERLPGYMNPSSPRVTCGLGTIPRTVGEGLNIYSGLLSLPEAMARIEAIYRPYHRNLAALLGEAHNATGVVLLVDCHSMPSSAVPCAREGTNWHSTDIVIGDRFGSTCDGRITKEAEVCLTRHGLNVVRNKPYAGGFITETHGQPRIGKHALQIEINRALYMDESSRQPNDDYDALKLALNDLTQSIASLVLDLARENTLSDAAE